jgi:hypothetical protein
MRYVTRLSLSVLPEKAQNYSAMVSRSIAHTFRRVRPRDDTSFLAVTITMGSRSPWVPLRCVERPGHALTMVPSYLYSSFFARSAASSTCYSRRLTGRGDVVHPKALHSAHLSPVQHAGGPEKVSGACQQASSCCESSLLQPASLDSSFNLLYPQSTSASMAVPLDVLKNWRVVVL